MKNLVFDSKKEALEFLSSIEGLSGSDDGKYFIRKGTYYLSNGEYSRPDYKPRRYKDGWGINVTYYYYFGACYAPKCGRVDTEKFVNQFYLI